MDRTETVDGRPLAGVGDALEALERKVEAVLEAMQRLREERDAQAERAEAGEKRAEELERKLVSHNEAGRQVNVLEKEKEGLLRDRAAVTQRVESILRRLESLGLE